ncbi:putative signal transducing protein [Marinifilum sp.]|uniref:putative signal transducing protein n=1 Tax=Marinifilum sp. TaxID=2033137 RepID=UPI003BA9D556
MNETENKLIEVYAGLSWEVEMLKSILEDHEIKAFVKDEFIGTLAPHYTAGGVGAVKLCISSADLDRAKPLVEKFLKNKDE